MKKKILEIYTNKSKLWKYWAICLVLFVLLFSHSMKYRQMKVYYNKGIKCYKSADYSRAETYFKQALWQKHTKRQECNIRINEALSIVKPITPESITSENFDEKIERLEYAKVILCDNNCAHMDDNGGHSKPAQTLKNEIDEYIEMLKKSKAEAESLEKEKQTAEQNNLTDEEKKQLEDEQKKLEDEQKAKEEEDRKAMEKQNELKEQFNQIEQQGLEERNTTLETYKMWNTSDYSYSGKSW